jgi:hypothetical protein
LAKGSHVYVEANYELREPETGADPESPQGQRQIFLKHGGTPSILYADSTPGAHSMSRKNQVVESPDLVRQIGGGGQLLDSLWSFHHTLYLFA